MSTNHQTIVSLFVVLYVFASHPAIAKEKQHKPAFSLIQHIGLLTSPESAFGTAQFIAGVQYARLFVGIGLSVDPYYAFSFPIFLHTRYTIVEQRLTFFTYGDFGMNKPYYSRNRFPRKYDDGREAYTIFPGWYYDIGIGIQTNITKSLKYHVSIGSSFKETSFQRVNYGWQSSTITYDIYRNIASRLSIKMGLQF
jgi:hypothetical protein